MGTLLRQMRGNHCSEKWKQSIEIWSHFVLSFRFPLYFDSLKTATTSVTQISRYECNL